ncbi:MAG: zf-HC2 domain-containing protein [Chloroflexi bacterium]|nr:zf-HC2 domain-containing protein [Ktedonobacteraceae bacterium]MBV9021277.1 zf-HC2 domain-containing protein [Ktedonobacteraceae bacterium]MBV9706576.1 zf-HC2 domain-containing protein [Chloroflexota bacterium]
MGDCIDCIETVARLHLYLDRELNAEEVTIVQRHLVACPECKCRFHFDMRIKRLIHERCTIECAPAQLREAIMRLARLPRSELAALDPEVKAEIKADLGL